MIDILLSTYQGEKYLDELLASIINQTYQDWLLCVRDDGSTDGTMSILNTYQIKYPGKIKIISHPKGNIGIVRSFEELLQASSSEYIMFCDQDDVWLPNKVELTLHKMQHLESAHSALPLLVHTDLTVVDSDLQVISPSFWNFSKLDQCLLSRNFNYLGVCNGVTGCTAMINRPAKESALPFPATARMHDAWIALCVAKNGKIDYVDESTILYRQHAKNVIGAQTIERVNYIKSKFRNLSKVVQDNKKQRAMLKELSYGNGLKYFWYKSLYFFRARL